MADAAHFDIRRTTVRYGSRARIEQTSGVQGSIGIRRSAVVVGREVELDRLLRAINEARAGRAPCLFVRGEGGVGKTRLLSEVATTSRRIGIALLGGRAPITTPLPFSVIAEALRSWLRGHPHAPLQSPFDRGLQLVLPEWESGPNATDLSEAQLRLLAFEGIVHLARDIAHANDGAVILLDDLHAADPETLEAVRYLATARVDRVLLVGAMRDRESPTCDELVRALRADGVAETLDLAPLDEREIIDLVGALLDSDPPAALVADIAARTDGVPLLIEEVLDAHVRAGSIEVSAAGTQWRGGTSAVPKTIREMVASRLDRLPREQREVLVVAAVLGDFDATLLGKIADATATIDDAIAGGIRVGLLETTAGAIGYRHAVVREAVIENTPPHMIEATHRRAAAALAGDNSFAERRARHLIAVGDDDDAAVLLTYIANERLHDHALLGAERLALEAAELAQSNAARTSAADTLAQSLSAQGRWLEALAVDEATTATHGETSARNHRMALSAIEGGRPEFARPIIATALASGDTSAAILLAAGRVAMVEGDAQQALKNARQILDQNPTIDDRLLALELQGRAFDYLGDREAAIASWSQQAHEAKVAGRTQAQLRAVVQIGKVDLFAGLPPTRLYEAVDLARDAGALVELGWAQENLSIALGIQGDMRASAAVLEDAIPRCRALRLDQLAYLLSSQAAVKSFTTEDVEALLAEAEALIPTDDVRLHTTSLRGDIALRYGRYADAVKCFEVCDEIMANMPGIVPIDSPCWMVWALAADGRPDDAARALAKAGALPDLARWYGRPVLVAAGEALLAGDIAGVDAVVASAPPSMPMDIALMRLVGADVIDDRATRIRWLRAALDIYDKAGASLVVDRVRGLLRAAGGPVPRRRKQRATVPAALAEKGVTTREAEVLRLLGEGLSNAEIAERLYLSVRTVESHVSSLLTKLDARGRGQLTALSGTITYD